MVQFLHSGWTYSLCCLNWPSLSISLIGEIICIWVCQSSALLKNTWNFSCSQRCTSLLCNFTFSKNLMFFIFWKMSYRKTIDQSCVVTSPGLWEIFLNGNRVEMITPLYGKQLIMLSRTWSHSDLLSSLLAQHPSESSLMHPDVLYFVSFSCVVLLCRK